MGLSVNRVFQPIPAIQDPALCFRQLRQKVSYRQPQTGAVYGVFRCRPPARYESPGQPPHLGPKVHQCARISASCRRRKFFVAHSPTPGGYGGVWDFLRFLDLCLSLPDEMVKPLAWTTFVSGIREPELIQYLKERRLYVNEPVQGEEDD